MKACEVVDECLGMVVDAGLDKGYTVLVTGDHGNVETMFYPDGSPNPSHGVNPVPFILISDDEALRSVSFKKDVGLSSVAPTVLRIMNLEKPDEMDADHLFL